MSEKLSDYLARRLADDYGVRDVFMVSGGGAMHINDSFGKTFRCFCNHNEQASGLAGEAYARAGDRLAVVSVTTGPGGLNALNGVFGSWTDSVPVLFISGQVKRATNKTYRRLPRLRQLGDQEVDIVAAVRDLTKYAVTVTKPEEIAFHLDKAVYLALHGRKGPVWLDIPVDVQSSQIDERSLKKFKAPKKPTYDLKMKKVVRKLSAAKRPLIVAGYGLRLSGQTELFNAWSLKNAVPVVTTLNGFDQIAENDGNYVGRIGTIGQRGANFALQNADCVLFLGTRNNIRQASYAFENFAKNAFKIVVDIDKEELKKPTVRPDLAVCADLADFMPAFARQMPALFRYEWLDWCRARRFRYDFAHTPQYRHQNGKINAYAAVRAIDNAVEKDGVCVMANATTTICTFQTAEIKSGQRFFSNSGDASMGYDLPAAIGACVAKGNAKTVCLAGDGSVMMNLQELQTIVHYRLPIKIFIINNDGYVSIKQTQHNFFAGRECGAGRDSGVSMPDFVKIGKAFGLKTLRADTPDTLLKTIRAAMDGDEPVLCEIVVDENETFIPKLASRQNPDGTISSPSLEDMYPFLPRDEFADNMISP